MFPTLSLLFEWMIQRSCSLNLLKPGLDLRSHVAEGEVYLEKIKNALILEIYIFDNKNRHFSG